MLWQFVTQGVASLALGYVLLPFQGVQTEMHDKLVLTKSELELVNDGRFVFMRFNKGFHISGVIGDKILT